MRDGSGRAVPRHEGTGLERTARRRSVGQGRREGNASRHAIKKGWWVKIGDEQKNGVPQARHNNSPQRLAAQNLLGLLFLVNY